MSDTYGIHIVLTKVKRVRGLMKSTGESMNEDKKQVKDLIKKLNTKKYFTMYFHNGKNLW